MNELFSKLRAEIITLCKNPDFVHSDWFIKWHLEIVEKISLELCEKYKQADKNLVLGLVWMHDYAKLVDREHEHEESAIQKGRPFLENLGFEKEYIDNLIKHIEIFERKMTEDLRIAPIEVQIVSSADAASHMVGPFYFLWWYENPNKPFEELMEDNKKKALKDWERKITLPEVKEAFKTRHNHILEQAGNLPDKFLN